MLYDKRWEKPEVKADPFSLESLISWLEKQPEDAAYCFGDWGGCLIAKFLQTYDRDARVADGYGDGYRYEVNGQIRDFSHWGAIAHGNNGLDPALHTFGQALERARKFLR